MIAGELRYLAVAALVLSLSTFCGCSKGKEAQKEDTVPATQQAAEAVRDFAKKPMDNARAVQKLGEDRTKAVDEAVGSENRQ
jgi:hypothetical protein